MTGALLPALLLLAALAAPARADWLAPRPATFPTPKAAGLPIAFEANHGQWDPRTRFVARLAGATARITPVGASFTADGGAPLTLRFAGGRSSDPVAEAPLAARSNYLIGPDRSRWVTGVPSYRRVRQSGVWPGIDVVYHGTQGRFEYDFEVAPGARPADVALRLGDRDDVRLRRDGTLVIEAGAKTVRQPRPVAYQVAAGRRQRVRAGYRLEPDGTVRLRVGSYDPTRPLVVDPVIVNSTYLGGSQTDYGSAVASGADGSTFVAGGTSSANFPGTTGTRMSDDAFVAKFDAAGEIVFTTFFGGQSSDSATGLALSPEGRPRIAGMTFSELPIVNGPQTTRHDGSHDGFVVEFSADGTAVTYSTYLGGSSTDFALDIASAGGGQVVVVGQTTSSDLPTVAASQPALGGSTDGFLVRLDTSGGPFLHSTYLGGSAEDHAYGVASGPDGSAFAVGRTASANFPTAAPRDASLSGIADGFLARFAPTGGTPLYSTYHGGGGHDYAHDLAVDADGAAHVAGVTNSTDFPVVNAAQPVRAGGSDAYVTKFTPSGAGLTYSTHFGGSADEVAMDIVLVGGGKAAVAGFTYSPDFPTRASVDNTVLGTYDGFVTQLSQTGATIDYAVLLGGDQIDAANGIANAGAGRVAVAGDTASDDFPTHEPRQGERGGSQDAFLTVLDGSDVALPETFLLSGPDDPSPSNAATFTFESSEPGVRFECRLDGGDYEDCASPVTYRTLTQGPHTLRVRAVDASHNVDASPASYTWVVDATPPETSVTSGPASPTNATTAEFVFASSAPGSTFECKLDAGAFAPCTAPKTYEGLAGSSHTFAVRATDPAGNTDASAAEVAWTVDLAAPDTTVDGTPFKVSSSTGATFTFSASEGGSTFECSLDGGDQFACTSPRQFTSLADGPHTFAVRAKDPAGNLDPSSATYSWTVETLPPQTSITSGPASPTSASVATFAFDASEKATFECRLDAESFGACSSPLSRQDLAEGSHTFEVRATDASGKADATPAQHTWTIDAAPPLPFVLLGPQDALTGVPPAEPRTFTWEPATDARTAISRYEFLVDGAVAQLLEPADCTPIACAVTLPGPFAHGPHPWSVRAIDAAGNVRETSPRTFTVDAEAPTGLAVVAPADGARIGSATPLLTWSRPQDPGSGVSGYGISLDGAAAVTVPAESWQVPSPLADGAHEWTITARDGAGTASAPVKATFNVDTRAPSVVIAPLPRVVAGRQVTVDASASTDASGGRIVRYDFDLGADGSADSSGAEPSFAFTVPAPGTHTVRVSATDDAGNVGVAAASVEAEAAAAASDPKLTTLLINDGAFATSSLRVTLDVHPPPRGGVAAMILSNSSAPPPGAPIMPITGPQQDVPWELAAGDGSKTAREVHVFFLTAAGTEIIGANRHAQIIFDPTPPVIDQLNVKGKSRRRRVRVRATDRITGVDRVEVRVGRRVVRRRRSDRKGQSRLEVRARIRARGRVTVRAYDRAGNVVTRRERRR